MILAKDAPETLPGATRDTVEGTEEEGLRRVAEIGCAEAVIEHPPEGPEARKRAAEGVAAVMKKHPRAWDLNGSSPADHAEDELCEAVLGAMKQAADGPSPGEGAEPPENHS